MAKKRWWRSEESFFVQPPAVSDEELIRQGADGAAPIILLLNKFRLLKEQALMQRDQIAQLKLRVRKL